MEGHLFGIETEYGCLSHLGQKVDSTDRMIHKLKDHLFKQKRIGLLDLHHRAHDEPPGNGGFLLNGGRIYIDMGHIEYATPECTRLFDLVAYDRAGDQILCDALEAMGISDRFSFIKNNIDYATGATFGSHENYLVSRQFPFTLEGLGELVPFLVTRQIFSGTGRIGSNLIPDGFILLEGFGDTSLPSTRGGRPEEHQTIRFQLSQRADHIVNDFYQWVQFNRAIVNTRDEPLADPAHYRRIHLLLGDSNLSEFATALKIGTTALTLELIEYRVAPRIPIADPVAALKSISRDPTWRWELSLEQGNTTRALDVQRAYLDAARRHCAGRDDDTDWVLQQWERVLDDLEVDPRRLVGRVDWASKLWLFDAFMEGENIPWEDASMKSLDIEYHNLDPTRGLYLGLEAEGKAPRQTTREQCEQAVSYPPADTRAAGRSMLIRNLLRSPAPYVINWSSFHLNGKDLLMGNPFLTYLKEAKAIWNETTLPAD